MTDGDATSDDEPTPDGTATSDDEPTPDGTATSDDEPTPDGETTASANGIAARYSLTDAERVLAFERDGRTAVVAQNRDGYAMLKVRTGVDGDELERYYGFDMALDHVAERLGVAVHDLPVPGAAADMGM